MAMQNEVNKPGWEERYAKYNPRDFEVTIILPGEHDLDEIEVQRTLLKLEILEEFVQDLALALTKGSLKYYSDDRSPEEWAAFEEDEQNDVVNYRLLRKVSERQRGRQGRRPQHGSPPKVCKRLHAGMDSGLKGTDSSRQDFNMRINTNVWIDRMVTVLLVNALLMTSGMFSVFVALMPPMVIGLLLGYGALWAIKIHRRRNRDS